MNAKNRIALVTGASKGVGRGIALGLAAAGWDVIVNYHRDETGAAETAAEVRACQRQCWTMPTDVGDSTQVQAMFAANNLPRMDELTDAPTRPLDGFETAALQQLQAGTEIVVEEDAGELRMLGSLRAAKQCTECHAVSRGDLLGAFTYRLQSDIPVRRGPVRAAKPVL